MLFFASTGRSYPYVAPHAHRKVQVLGEHPKTLRLFGRSYAKCASLLQISRSPKGRCLASQWPTFAVHGHTFTPSWIHSLMLPQCCSVDIPFLLQFCAVVVALYRCIHKHPREYTSKSSIQKRVRTVLTHIKHKRAPKSCLYPPHHTTPHHIHSTCM